MGPSLSRLWDRLPSLSRGGAMLPPRAHSRFGLAPGLGLPQFLLSTTCLCYLFHKSHLQVPYTHHMKLKSFYTCLELWAHDTLHTYTNKLQLFFLLLLVTCMENPLPHHSVYSAALPPLPWPPGIHPPCPGGGSWDQDPGRAKMPREGRLTPTPYA
jgi:hypothetical protein